MATEEQKRLDTRQTIRFESKHPLQSVFYESFSDVPHNVHYADGQPIWVKVAGTYTKHVFQRTNDREPDGGQWLATTLTAGAAATW